MEKSDFDNRGEILNYDGFVLSTPYEDHYMLMNNTDIINSDDVEEGETIRYNIEDELVSEAMVEVS